MTDLGVLPGDTESGATAINRSGQVVGTSDILDPETYNRTARSFLYSNGVMINLGVPSTESGATDINNGGQVVGSMRVAAGLTNPLAYRAYIYRDGVVTDLNALNHARMLCKSLG
jgi:probable HAF family extracellular repeat protein